MATHMLSSEALELVKLRIKEDGIDWPTAYKEYRQLTGTSVSESMYTGRYIQKYAATLNSNIQQ